MTFINHSQWTGSVLRMHLCINAFIISLMHLSSHWILRTFSPGDITLCYRWGNWGSERWSDLLKDPQQKWYSPLTTPPLSIQGGPDVWGKSWIVNCRAYEGTSGSLPEDFSCRLLPQCWIWSYSKPLGRSQDLGDFGCNTKNEGSLEVKHRALASALWGLNPLPTTH